MCLWLCTTSVHNTTQNSSDDLPSYLQTNIIAQMLSIGGEGVPGRLLVLEQWYIIIMVMMDGMCYTEILVIYTRTICFLQLSRNVENGLTTFCNVDDEMNKFMLLCQSDYCESSPRPYDVERCRTNYQWPTQLPWAMTDYSDCMLYSSIHLSSPFTIT